MNRVLFSFARRPTARRSCGLLLLMLPLSGSIVLPSTARAQDVTPTTTSTVNKITASGLTAEQKALMAKLVAVAHLEEVCSTQVNLKVDKASVSDIIAALGKTMPEEKLQVEVRGAPTLSDSFDVKGVRVGDILEHIAQKTGYGFYVFSSGLLLSPADKLTDAQRDDVQNSLGGRWANSTVSGGHTWSLKLPGDKLFAKAVAEEMLGSHADPLPAKSAKGTFVSLSADSQTMLRQMVMWMNQTIVPEAEPFELGSDATILVDTTHAGSISFSVHPGNNDPRSFGMGINIR